MAASEAKALRSTLGSQRTPQGLHHPDHLQENVMFDAHTIEHLRAAAYFLGACLLLFGLGRLDTRP